jgi:hypothetical protein
MDYFTTRRYPADCLGSYSGIVIIVIPPGLNAAKGGEAAVDFLEE